MISNDMLIRLRAIALLMPLSLGLAVPAWAQASADLSLPDAVRTARSVPAAHPQIHPTEPPPIENI